MLRVYLAVCHYVYAAVSYMIVIAGFDSTAVHIVATTCAYAEFFMVSSTCPLLSCSRTLVGDQFSPP